MRLRNNEKGNLKRTSKPRFVTQRIFDSDLVAIHKIKTILSYNKLAYVKVCISKVLMHEFHFDEIKEKKCGNKSRLLFTDIASLVYEIETANVYDDFSENKEMFNFSNYSTKSNYYDGSNVLAVGKMKNEMGGAAIVELVGLKPKMYSILVSNSSKYNKAKD